MAGLFPRTPDNFRMLGLAESSSRLKDGGPRFYPDPHQLHAIVGGGTLGWLSALLSSSQQASYTDIDTMEINPMGVGFPALPSMDDFLPPALMTPTRNGDINTRLDTWIFNEAGPGQRVVDGGDAGGGAGGDGNDKVKVNVADAADYLDGQFLPMDGAAANSQVVHFKDDAGAMKGYMLDADILSGVATTGTWIKVHYKTNAGCPVSTTTEVSTADWRLPLIVWWAKEDDSGTPANLAVADDKDSGVFTYGDDVNHNEFMALEHPNGAASFQVTDADGHLQLIITNPGQIATEAVMSILLLSFGNVEVTGTFQDIGDGHP